MVFQQGLQLEQVLHAVQYRRAAPGRKSFGGGLNSLLNFGRR